MALSDRINRAPEDRRTDELTPIVERREAPRRTDEFVPVWRRRMIRDGLPPKDMTGFAA
jgi:hypothetical protein